MKFFSVLLLLFVLFSCKTYSEKDLSSFDQEIESYLAKKKITCERSPSGLYYSIETAGEGRLIQYTDIVSFKYTGKLLDGTVFDQQKEPVEFEVSQLIGAWKEIMLELRKGGKAFLVAPPQLGYGTHDLEDIPPNSILVFDLEIVDIK